MSTSRTDVMTAVREEVAATLPDLSPQTDPAADLRDELGVDSLALLELVARLEYRFGTAVPDEAWPDLRSLDTVTDFFHHAHAVAS